MHPAGYYLAQAHLTRLRQLTQRAALARDARRQWPHQAVPLRPRLAGIVRKTFAALAPRSTPDQALPQSSPAEPAALHHLSAP